MYFKNRFAKKVFFLFLVLYMQFMCTFKIYILKYVFYIYFEMFL